MTRLLVDDASRPPYTKGRLSRLLTKGKEISFTDEDGELFVWIQALNSMQREEALKDGAIALAKSRIKYSKGNTEYDMFIEEATSAELDEIVNAIIQTSYQTSLWIEAQDDLLAMDKWAKRPELLELIQRGDQAVKDGLEMDEEEMEGLSELNDDYLKDWRTCLVERIGLKRQELLDKPRKVLEEELLDSWLALKQTEEQIREYDLTAIWHSTRCCSGTRKENGVDHSSCANHQTKVFTSRSEVRDASDELTNPILAAIRELDSAADVLGGGAR